jgi:hypothetical protein
MRLEKFLRVSVRNKEYKEFLYKDALLNPTNLRDKTDDFEEKIVERFRKESGLKEISGFRNLFGKQVFYSTHPIIITKQSCLRCHSTPEAAPKSQIAPMVQQMALAGS